MTAVPGEAVTVGDIPHLSGAFTSRTIMLAELRLLFAACPPAAMLGDYRAAIIVENMLLKPTQATRARTFTYLRDRYGLDPSLPTFRALRDLWDADESAQPLLAALTANARDPLLRATASVVLPLPPGTAIEPADLGQGIAAAFPDRFNDNTLLTTGQRAASSWQQSGHLTGKAHKVRARALCRPVTVAYALLLGHLGGVRGDALFSTLWAQILDAPTHVLREQAAEAGRLGWIDYRSAGAVTEVGFRHLLRGQEDRA